MAEINAAWAILRDPERRAAWDRRTRAASATPTDRGTTHRTGHGPRRGTPPRRPSASTHGGAHGRAAEHRRRLAPRPARRGRGGSAARQPAGQRAPVRAPHRVVAGRDRPRRPGLPRSGSRPHREGGRIARRSTRSWRRCASRPAAESRQPGRRRAHLPLGGARPPSSAGEERRDPVERVLAHRQEPVPELGVRHERRRRRSVGMAASSRSMPRERVRRPRQQQRRHVDRRPVRDPRGGGLGAAGPVERVGQADQRRVRVRARRPRPGRGRRRPRATRPGRRTSDRR